jgi:hypothetical protein
LSEVVFVVVFALLIFLVFLPWVFVVAISSGVSCSGCLQLFLVRLSCYFSVVFIMSLDNTIVRFNGKNFPTWPFQFKMFLEAKELSHHLDSFVLVPTDEKELAQWEVKDAKVISCLLGTFKPHLVTNLRCFTMAQAMWAYLHRIYHQDHSAQKFQLEMEISTYTQGNLTIEKFYSSFINIWSEYSAIVHFKVPTTVVAALQAVHAERQHNQFLNLSLFEPVY